MAITIHAALLREMGATARRAEEYAEPLTETCNQYGIDNGLRVAHFLAQLFHESYRLRYKREVWGPTAQQKRYEPPSTLATRLGNTEEGDGYLFRGRGLIQLTGRYNYEKYAESLSERFDECFSAESIAMLLDETKWACDVAGWYWDKQHLNQWADQDNVREVTRRINGGYNGLDDREALLVKAKDLLLLDIPI